MEIVGVVRVRVIVGSGSGVFEGLSDRRLLDVEVAVAGVGGGGGG